MQARTHILAALALLAVFVSTAEAVTADANHILVADEAEIIALKAKIESAADSFAMFQEVAKEKSTCPSGKSGGSLGTFQPGQMVKEFNDVVFTTGEVGKVEGPVKTQFGYHLIWITRRA